MKSRAYRPIMLFLVVLCCGGISQAQDPETGLYRSFFGEESSSWNGVIQYYDFPENCWIRTNGDTIIDDNVYKKIQYGGTYFLSSYVNLFLREDRSHGRLWCRYQNDTSDMLIADMSLAIGDTILLKDLIHAPFSIIPYRVTDTINGEVGLTIVLKSRYTTIKFIEGVGCSNLPDCLKINSTESQILCYHKDGELVYHEPYKDYPEEDCKVVWVGLDELNVNVTVSIWPNPCNDWFMINSDYVQSIELYDVMGRLIVENIVPQKKIDIGKLPRGVYLLRVKHNSSIITKKIIKK